MSGCMRRMRRRKGIEVETYTYKLDEVDRAILDGEDEGFARIHIQKGTDKIVGATIVAAHAGDMISEFSVAMKAGAGAKTIAGTIHPYPTQAEVNKKVVNLWRKAHFTPRTKNLLMKLFAWMRRDEGRRGRLTCSQKRTIKRCSSMRAERRTTPALWWDVV